MIERFVNRTDFDSYDDFARNFALKVPENFNFAYDVVDAWAETEPDREALLWTNPAGDERRFTFGRLKELSDRTAAYFQALGVGRGTRVMLMLKRRSHRQESRRPPQYTGSHPRLPVRRRLWRHIC